ncbi:hypothetical protein BDV95DRAFT_597554 [Massariosphaeria phaeospora]|uniref:Uncharacterized protein n=1 Tax=Massariosphaeria phaeospora TaxID=100035 RepID=A0A7C8I4Y1_9PLEO|nr:hypothetical protein BDV95DRAFT_597554 [Massariosphaeria phaeospora]
MSTNANSIVDALSQMTLSSSAPSTLNSTPGHTCADFSIEIRESIYEWAMRIGGHFNGSVNVQSYTSSTAASRPGFLPACCWTSNAEWAIAARVYIRHTTFEIRTIHANRCLERFLASLPNNTGFAALKEIST